jgi:hypothetical protein
MSQKFFFSPKNLSVFSVKTLNKIQKINRGEILSEGHATTTRARERESESERDDRAGSRRDRW